jgi:type II secretory pathway pseudopilin PulG
MTRERLTMIIAIGLVPIVVVLAIVLAIVAAGLGGTQSHLRTEQRDLKHTQSALVAAQSQLRTAQSQLRTALHTFAVSQKASTKTRVSTVSQRCDLTRLILGVLDRVHDTVDAAGFHESEAKCLTQLASVKKINAATPSPK